MATQNGLPSSDSAAPPFASKDGLPTVKDGGGGGAAMPIDRPQSEARPEVVPSQGEARSPVILLADPTGQAGNSGAITPKNDSALPFKGLK